VLQEQSWRPIGQRELFLRYVRRFAAECARAGTRMALFETWPRAERRGDAAVLDSAFAEAAETLGLVRIPVGRAWRAVLEEYGDFPLYAADGVRELFASSSFPFSLPLPSHAPTAQSHPSPQGLFLTCLVFRSTLFGQSAEDAPHRLALASAGEFEIPDVHGMVLRRIALRFKGSLQR
jgi:hypothetical protein